MTDLSSMLQVILQDSGYRTSSTSVDDLPAVCFEDDALLGFVCIFGDVASLLARWQMVETALLTKHALPLQVAGDKAWNVYCVFLSSAAASPLEQHELDWIEENQERTRKIAAASIAGRDALLGALLPVLPLQYRAAVMTEDLTARLRKRIATIAPDAGATALDDKVPAAEVARILGAPI